MRINRTDQRAAWATAHKAEIEAARVPVTGCPRGGTNAANMGGMSRGGWGYWARALRQAGIECNVYNYWSGSATTPSTAINRGIADYITAQCPAELM